MMLCQIVGSAISTACHPSLEGWRLALCQKITAEGESEGQPFVAIDPFGAGMHQRVIVTTDGSGARDAIGDSKSPVRNSILGLADDPIN